MSDTEVNYRLKPVITKEAIAARTKELGAEISKYYQGKDVVAVCVLKGAFMFFADLVRHLNCNLEIDFIRLSSYGTEMQSSGKIQVAKDVDISLRGRHVLIVEDIVDSGRSMAFLVKFFQAKGAESIRICSLIDKKERRVVEVDVDFSAFSLEKGFAVGYGLDWAERLRELDGVYEVEFL